MWYAMIRIVIGVIVGIGLFLVLKKIKIKKRIVCCIFPVLLALLSSYLLYCIPIENLFVNFTSIEKVFYYLYTGNIEGTIDGASSTLVLYTANNNTHSHAIIPKKGSSWKLDVFQFNTSILSKTVDRRIINIYNARNTNDYYVTVWDPLATEVVEITDNKGGNFEYIEEENKATSTKNITYYSYVKNITEGYTLTIAGNQIKIY